MAVLRTMFVGKKVVMQKGGKGARTSAGDGAGAADDDDNDNGRSASSSASSNMNSSNNNSSKSDSNSNSGNGNGNGSDNGSNAVLQHSGETIRVVPTPTATHVTRWCTDPHARGSYSYIKVGRVKTREGQNASKRVKGKPVIQY